MRIAIAEERLLFIRKDQRNAMISSPEEILMLILQFCLEKVSSRKLVVNIVQNIARTKIPCFGWMA